MRKLTIMKDAKLINVNLLSDSIQRELLTWRNQDFIRINMFNRDKITESQHQMFIQSLKQCQDEKQFFIFFVDDIAKGVIQYYMYNGEYELGYYIINEEDKGKRFGQLMEFILLEYMFEYLKIDKVVTRTLRANTSGMAFQKSMGFEIENNDELEVCLQILTSERWQYHKPYIQNKISIENYNTIIVYDYANNLYRVDKLEH